MVFNQGSTGCLWKMNFVCVYQKHDSILKSLARNIKLKFFIEFFYENKCNFLQFVLIISEIDFE